jgi:adapter protein MecA 1/2
MNEVVMKVKQISDSTLKITIQLEDLEERGMEIADFLIPQEKTEEFFIQYWMNWICQ